MSFEFNKYAQEGNKFINDVAKELHSEDHGKAGRITQVVLHAIRDRLPPDEAIQFAQQLPIAIKGIYIDQMNISKNPVKIRKKEEFVEFIKNKLSVVEGFEGTGEIIRGAQAVFKILCNYLSEGQIEQLKNNIGGNLFSIFSPEAVKGSANNNNK